MAPLTSFNHSSRSSYLEPCERSRFSSSFTPNYKRKVKHNSPPKSSCDKRKTDEDCKKETRRAREKHAKTLTELQIAYRKISLLEDELKRKESKLQSVVTQDVYVQLINRVKELESTVRPYGEIIEYLTKLLNKKNNKIPHETEAELYQLRSVNFDLSLQNEKKDQQLANFRSLFWRSM